MKCLPLALAVLAGCWLVASASLAHAASTLCVGGPGCYPSLQAAVNAAHDGDTITITPGTYAGGVTIDKSVKLMGAGAGKTAISGGGPVLTIGTIFAADEPTVTISGLTITGGVTRSSPESTPFTGKEGVFAAGGGIEIPPNADFSGGAAVTISNSVITGNRVAPEDTVGPTPDQEPFWPVCPSGFCPFAGAFGGGIDNWGTLTLTNTSITNNRVGSASGLSTLASDADGAGIDSRIGSLTISNSVISANQASATAPTGRFADSGGIFVESGALTMSSSSVTNNSATLNAALPNSVDLLAVAGGIHISDQATGGSIRNTTVSDNAVTMTNTAGDANAFSGGVHIDSNNLELSNDVITNNSVTVATLGQSPGNAAGDSGAGEMGGTISNSRLAGNSVSASSVAGDAIADAGAVIFAGSMTNSVVSDNHVHAESPHGTAIDRGGGIVGGDAITLRNTTVSGNTANASGRTGFARGGGIFDIDQSANGGPSGGLLTLINSRVTNNVLSGSSNITLQGGGLFVTNPLTLRNSIISGNVPDNCFGSSC